MTEVIEGMVAGESIHVLAAELCQEVPKVLRTDSTSAISVLMAHSTLEVEVEVCAPIMYQENR